MRINPYKMENSLVVVVVCSRPSWGRQVQAALQSQHPVGLVNMQGKERKGKFNDKLSGLH